MVRWSPKVQRPVSIDAGSPIVLDVFLRAVGGFVFIHIEELFIHHLFEHYEVTGYVAFKLIRYIEWHYN